MNIAENSAVKGKHIAITGILAFYKRKDAFDLICDHEGIPQEYIIKNRLSGGGLVLEKCSEEREIKQKASCRAIYRSGAQDQDY